MSRALKSLFVAALCGIWIVSPAAAAQQDSSHAARINKGTVGIVSGGVNGTYVRIASDLAATLDDGDELRVLPVVGKGSVQNIADVLYLKGIDIGIVQSDVLTYIKRNNIYSGITGRIHYITKLYNEELHLIAGDGIGRIQDLAGRKVNFDGSGSGTYMTASIIFESLGIEVEPVTFDQALALEKLKAGEISALVYVAGKPTQLFKGLTAGDGLRFLPVPRTPELLGTYYPASLTAEDYPALIPAGQPVGTLAVGAVMAAFNWKPDSVRYRKVSRFIDAFFSRFAEFQQAPRHPKWREVSLTAEVPGWTRFWPAENWLRAHRTAGQLRMTFETFLEQEAPSVAGKRLTEQEKIALFRQFIRWQNGGGN